MDESNIYQIVVQPILTVLGWFVAAFWAIKQVNLAHSKNIKFQQQLIRESHKREIAKEIIDIYKNISRIIESLKQNVLLFSINYKLENNNNVGSSIQVSAQSSIGPVNDIYSELGQEISRLEMWMKICGDHLPDTALLEDGVNEFRKTFSINADYPNIVDIGWVSFQRLLVNYQAGEGLDSKELSQVTSQLCNSLQNMLVLFTDGTERVNHNLITV